ncbi:hypothetical protein LSTR_LSTR003331 [Laodelphax striatellus]|uniref:Anaphase-promoting complex subunit 2 n=1 Tax=Laodelphax striatellus TaxID=195883 RepID=A0A482X6A7_LAOST|nr:hypothetical protein LSTR_LSTR003331 [Laodelphax striatellus]
MAEISMEQISAIWEERCCTFPILSEEVYRRHDPDMTTYTELQETFLLVKKHALGTVVEDLVIERIEQEMRNNIVPKFWNYFEDGIVDGNGFETFRNAVDYLYHTAANFTTLLDRIHVMRNHCDMNRLVYGEEGMYDTFKVILRSTLHAQLPLKYQTVIEDFYKVSFKVFCKSEKGNLEKDANESGELVVSCGGCDSEIETCRCEKIIEYFHNVNRQLIELELLESLAGDVLTALIHKRIENHVQETCQGSFDKEYIKDLEDWLQNTVMGWLMKIYNQEADTSCNESIQKSIFKFKQKLMHFMYETYTKTRIDQLFNIIIEYPDSDPAIYDLRICLEKTDLRGFLIQKFQRALETRLLHSGVNTPDILTAYIASIKALRQLDSTGVLLETVTQPIRQYLRSRNDTVRCVVTNLTEEGPGDLAEELVRGETDQVDEHTSADAEMENWETWKPDPVDSDPMKTPKSRRTSDIISMLVNVYGSKELFVNEYRTLLADRLLSQFHYNTEKEIRYLELLKLRFGDSQLHYCEVMLKDVYDSKRINAHLHTDPNFDLSKQPYPTTALILSAQFWPPFKEDTLELPATVKERLAVYTKSFETLKGNRTLNWKPHLGSVNLDIELKDRTINLTVSPIHAAIIWHFQTKNQWTIEELSLELMVPATALRRRIAFWQSQVFWSYIVGMLTNLDSMPLERIHQMLKMFASQGPSSVECSVQELRLFLDRKVREHKLLFSGGFYRLPKT